MQQSNTETADIADTAKQSTTHANRSCATTGDRLADLTAALCAFRDARDWRQFHGVRQLMVSLNLEVAEVLELSQWKSDDELEQFVRTKAGKEALADECADVLSYLLLLTDAAQIDLASALRHKMNKNAAKYPLEKCRGKADKYTAWQA